MGGKWLRRQSISVPLNAFFGLLVLFFFFLIVSTVHSPLPFLSQNKFFLYLNWIVFIGLIALTPSPSGRGLNLGLTLLECLGVPLILYGFLQHFGYDPKEWTPWTGRIFSTLGNADHFGGIISILFSLSLIRLMMRLDLWRFLLMGGEFLALGWSYTRAPFVALFIAGLTVSILFHKFFSFGSKLLRVSLLATLILLILAFVYHSTEGRRFDPRFWKNDPDIVGRKYLFEKGVEVLTLHPWTGIGPGSFSFSYLLMRGDEPVFYRTRLAIGESTHNTFLDLFAETGMPGGVLFLFLWLMVLYRLARKIAIDRQANRFDLLSIFVPLLVAFFVLQFIFPDVSLMALSGYLLGLGISRTCETSEIKTFALKPPFRVIFVILLVIFSGLIILYTSRYTLADRLKRQGDRELNQNHAAAAVPLFDEAAIWDPWEPSLYQKLGKAYELSKNPEKALLSYNHAVALNPNDPYVWADIGRLAAFSGWRKRALTAYVNAVDLDPYNPILYHDAALTAVTFNAYGLASYYDREARRLSPTNQKIGTIKLEKSP